ncbi:High-affinity zinc uptake system ATP-binding protein ZnuC [Chlamydia abortus]|uniref:metal ABC transporter ATP-binding protein n=1 Tax=Chlamydia abortus TaxID=83555 RepID=UPI00192B5853|nr:metal ABC transporter ATP-binding protein [Chlamydia abortus]CAD7583531.1 Zinc ABC transporter, ATP-binding protein ZnuC [Chlamydia abortus]CAG9046406.1 High-affinity zinc uptake system ATP-binding protein ZnuC [Chlamydia abortus]
MTVQILVKDLSFRYGPKSSWIINNVSFTVHEGDFIGIIGPNGGGKTTLALLLLGLLQPTTGTLNTFPSYVKTSGLTIGWVPQHFSYDFSFPISVKEVVLSGRLSFLRWHGKYSKHDHALAEQALTTVDLLHHKDACFSHLSGGQIQRVLLARALASQPKLLILDEPTANIDPENQQRILQILKELNTQCTILMITHDLHHTTSNFNKVFYMSRTLTTLTNMPTIPQEFCCDSFEKKADL